ncbi:hypothetical protein JW859_09190 [bacterium]|nr:hypothetical protein [bacterium]
MPADDIFDSDAFKALGNLAENLKDAFAEGLEAMHQAGDIAAEEMEPDHEVELAIQLTARVEGHPYKVDALVTFALELAPVLITPHSPLAAIAAALGSAGVDLGEDHDAVMEQLGMPRVIGAVTNISTQELELHGPDGRIQAELNRDASLLVTVENGQLRLNCEGVFSFPQHTGAYYAVPSMAAMQANLVIDRNNLDVPVKFDWTEPDKDNLRVSGTVVIRPLD